MTLLILQPLQVERVVDALFELSLVLTVASPYDRWKVLAHVRESHSRTGVHADHLWVRAVCTVLRSKLDVHSGPEAALCWRSL